MFRKYELFQAMFYFQRCECIFVQELWECPAYIYKISSTHTYLHNLNYQVDYSQVQSQALIIPNPPTQPNQRIFFYAQLTWIGKIGAKSKGRVQT